MRVAIAFLGSLILALTAHSANGQEAPDVPDEVLQNFRYFVGQWKTVGRTGDTKSEGTWSARWGKGKNCLLRESSFSEGGETMFGSGIIGWDPAKTCIAEYAFWTKNQSYTILWKLNSDGNLDGELTGFEEGKHFTAKAKVTKNSPNEFVFESKNAAAEEIEVVFHKVPRTQGKKAKEKQQ